MIRVRLALYALMFCDLSITGAAQQERAIPVVTAAAPVEKIRFAGSSSSAQMRIEVLSAAGAVVYDSGWRDGNILDWLPQNSSGQSLANGAYRLVMRSKSLAGQTSEKEVALRVESGGMTVADQLSASPKITLTAHDGEAGQLITTSGDLSFRFGDFLNRKDTEAMRLTPAGELSVNGVIHTKGVMFPDGTILTTAAGLPAARDDGGAIRQRASNSSGRSAAPQSRPVSTLGPLGPVAAAPAGNIHTPKPTASPDYQFKIDAAGVHIGTTSAFGLDVTGNLTLRSGLLLPVTTSTTSGVIMQGTNSFAHSYGSQNTFLGVNAGNFTLSGSANVGVGLNALTAATSGSSNTAIGVASLFQNGIGCCNTAAGDGALYSNLIGNNNTSNGFQTLYYNRDGSSNTASGYQALQTNTSGTGNIGIGYQAGINLTTGNYNIDIANSGVAAEGGTIRIGTSGNQSRAFIAGIRGVTVGADAINVVIDSTGQLGTTVGVGVPSSRRYKFDINSMSDSTEGLMRLRPVTFRYLAHGDNAPLQYGLIAEEVAEVYPEMVTRNKDGEVESVMYQFLAPMLLNEVQKQNRQIEEQQKTFDQGTSDLQAENAALRNQLERLTQRMERLEGKRNASE